MFGGGPWATTCGRRGVGDMADHGCGMGLEIGQPSTAECETQSQDFWDGEVGGGGGQQGPGKYFPKSGGILQKQLIKFSRIFNQGGGRG